jgi:hypothetical protein
VLQSEALKKKEVSFVWEEKKFPKKGTHGKEMKSKHVTKS